MALSTVRCAAPSLASTSVIAQYVCLGKITLRLKSLITHTYLQNGIILQIQSYLFLFLQFTLLWTRSRSTIKNLPYYLQCPQTCPTVGLTCEVIYITNPPLLDLVCRPDIILHTLHYKLLFKLKMSWTSIHVTAVGCWPNYLTSLNPQLLICRMGMCCEHELPEWAPVPSTENTLNTGPELELESLLWSPCPGFSTAFSGHSPYGDTIR